MRKRSIVLALVIALILVLAIAGSVSAKYLPKADPVVLDAECTWTHPTWPTLTGDYNFAIKWSLDAGKPIQWEIYVYNASMSSALTTFTGKLSAAQIKAGAATISLSNYSPGADYTFRVWVGNRLGNWDFHDYVVGS